MIETIDRRDMLRRVGSSLVGLAGLDLVLPDMEVLGADHTVIDLDGKYSNGGLHVLYNGPSTGLNLRVKLSNGKKTGLSYDTSKKVFNPSLGLGRQFDNYCVRAASGEKGGKICLGFEKGTRHGGFDIVDSMYEVGIWAKGGQLRIDRPSNWPYPHVSFDGDASISSGSNKLTAIGNKISISTSEIPDAYRGSTPLYITVLGADTEFEFLKSGRIRAHKRTDFPLPGEKRGR